MRYIILAASLALAGCTQNERAKHLGGTADVTLPPGRKLVNVTFKESNLWFLTRPAKPGEKPEVLEFSEDSSFGILNGKIVIREQ